MTPDLTFGWMSGRVFASGIWGGDLFDPGLQRRAVEKGAILGVLPWLSSIFFFLPFKMGAEWLGLALGNGTPAWTLFLVYSGALPAHSFWHGCARNFSSVRRATVKTGAGLLRFN